MNRRRVLDWADLGTVPYKVATRLQVDLRERLRRRECHEQLLLLEHPHVYTLGRSAGREDILASSEWLQRRGVEIAESDRGGQVTYHGPGQLVGYPILDLNPDRRDIRRYVRDLQEVLVRTLADFGVEARGRGEAALIGVWVGEAKIASIGVHLSRWITTHGFALNVSPDLDYFSAIVPCGLQSVRMTSIADITGRRPAISEVAAVCAGHCAAVFERELRPVPVAVPG